jgi:probable HAF family extracellular repeat protein
MKNLGTIGPVSQAFAINSKTQVVGTTGNIDRDLRACLWENGGPMLDLNKLVPAGSPRLAVALAINDRGEIFCDGTGEKGAYLLVPAPQLAIRVSTIAPVQTIAIDMTVIPGRRYSLEASGDLQTWTALGTSFTPETETVTRELETIEGGRFYRLTLLP